MKDEKGMALVITLVVLVIITAMVVEFSYGVYTTTTSLYNWRDSQRLSFVASSGLSLAIKTISDAQSFYTYTYPGRIELPVEDMLDGFKGRVLITAEDENSRFNINSMVSPNGLIKDKAYESFKRLLRSLDLDEAAADFVADWIDKDSEPRMRDSEYGVKNAHMDNVEELLLIKGIDKKTYEKLLPYVTVFGFDRIDSDTVNVNTASMPVIMSMDDNITQELAERIVAYRDIKPFERTSDIVKVAGFEGPLGLSLIGRIDVKARNFRITSAAEENRIKRIIECVVEVAGSSHIVRSWKEM